MKKYAVIGPGKFGFDAAKALFEDGNEVIAIDTDRVRVQAIDPFATETIVLNATDKEALRSLGLEEMDAVVVSINKSLKDLNLRAKHNIHIIAIKKPSPNGVVLIPPADYEIQATDTLMILGKTEDLKKIKVLV